MGTSLVALSAFMWQNPAEEPGAMVTSHSLSLEDLYMRVNHWGQHIKSPYS